MKNPSTHAVLLVVIQDIYLIYRTPTVIYNQNLKLLIIVMLEKMQIILSPTPIVLSTVQSYPLSTVIAHHHCTISPAHPSLDLSSDLLGPQVQLISGLEPHPASLPL